MALRAWVPAAGPLAELQREVNRLFDTVFGQQFGPLGRLRAGYVYPPMNIWESGEEYFVECEVPGLEMEDLLYIIRQIASEVASTASAFMVGVESPTTYVEILEKAHLELGRMNLSYLMSQDDRR
jgi:hypothetical protein